MLKALVVKATSGIPPKSHNLNYLKDLANVKLDDKENIFLAILMKYQLEGRYPDYYPALPEPKVIEDYLDQTKNILECLKKKL